MLCGIPVRLGSSGTKDHNGVGDIDVENSAFSIQPEMDAIRFTDIVRDPSGLGQRIRGPIAVVP